MSPQAILDLPKRRVVHLALRGKTPARVLEDHHVAALDKIVDIAGPLTAVFVIGQARQQDGKPSVGIRTIDIGHEVEAISGRRRHVFFDDDTVLRTTALGHDDEHL